MQGYFIQFIAYSMAMVGFLTICLLAYKKFSLGTSSKNSSDVLLIENCLRINARKQIYVLRAGNEKFLIAADTERTTMLAKLDAQDVEPVKENKPITVKKSSQVKHLGNVTQIMSAIEETPIMKRISEKMKA